MEENKSEVTQTTSSFANQPNRNTRPQSAPTVTQPSVPPVQTTQPSFQQPSINQQQIITAPGGESSKKSGIKRVLLMFFGLIALLVISGICLVILLNPTLKGLISCLDENEKDMNILFQRGAEEKWNTQQKCSGIKPINEKLVACYEDVGNNNLLPEQLAFTLGGIFNSSVRHADSESIIEQHNTNCIQYPETLIGN